MLAVEQPQAVVLNYAPGPLDTHMVTELLEDQRTDPGRFSGVILNIEMIIIQFLIVVRAMFEDLKRTGALLKPEDSAAAMVALLRKRNFQSGDHVDFYDDKVKEAVGGGGGAAVTASAAASTAGQASAATAANSKSE